MRVLKAFFTSFIVIAVIGLLGFLIAREVLLIMTLSKIQQSLNQVREADVNQVYVAECMNRGSSRNEKGRMHFTQLRFVDKNNYVLEAVCNQMEHNPIEFATGELPKLVTPLPGQSGIRWGVDTGLNFVCFKRVGSISVIEGVYKTSLKPTVLTEVKGPDSVCESYGYQCCDQNTQIGKGELLSNALDCPQTCHELCLDRPLILGFNTQPYYNRLTRLLEVNKNQTVTFSYMVTPNQDASFVYIEGSDDPVENFIATLETIFTSKAKEEAVKIYLDYGDGTVDEFAGFRGQAEHVYHCSTNSCEFQAKISVVKDNGVVSLDSAQNLINIKVN